MPVNNFYYNLASYVLAVFCLWGATGVAVAENPRQKSPVAAGANGQQPGNRDQLEQIVATRLGFYAGAYPDIAFVILDTAGDVSRNMQVLARIVGEDPIPLDYAHPESLRQSLLIVTLSRIELLLQSNISSATLFQPGRNVRRAQICVITMNPSVIAADDRAATRHLLVIPDSEFDAIPRARYLNHIDHLKFAVDHEVFHCLDTAYNGPIPMSQHRLWGEYYMLKNETGADAFGMIMHIAAYRALTAYARTLARIRGLTLLGDDPNHFTYPAINAVLKQNPQTLAADTLQQRFELASRISKEVVGSYDDYLRYAVAAQQAMDKLGIVHDDKKVQHAEVDVELEKSLLADTRDAFRALVGHELPGKGTSTRHSD